MTTRATIDRVILKDPDAELDYAMSWTAWLVEDDTISTAVVFVAAADGEPVDDPTLTIDTVDHDDTTVTFWLRGGETTGRDYAVTVRVETTQQRKTDRSFRVRIGRQ